MGGPTRVQTGVSITLCVTRVQTGVKYYFMCYTCTNRGRVLRYVLHYKQP